MSGQQRFGLCVSARHVVSCRLLTVPALSSTRIPTHIVICACEEALRGPEFLPAYSCLLQINYNNSCNLFGARFAFSSALFAHVLLYVPRCRPARGQVHALHCSAQVAAIDCVLYVHSLSVCKISLSKAAAGSSTVPRAACPWSMACVLSYSRAFCSHVLKFRHTL